MLKSSIPQHVFDNDELMRQIVVAVGECVAADMDESAWRKFAILHNLAEQTVDRNRFIRSLQWGDADHEGMVIEFIDHVFPANPKAFFVLFNRPGVQDRLQQKHPEILAAWNAQEDPLVDAIAHGVSEIDAVASVIDLSEYRNRIHAALPGDPRLAIGAAKDMLEATMRTIMDLRAKPQDKHIDFPALVTRCMTELGLTPNTRPADDAEKHVRKIANAAKSMIESANEFRNSAGTGHGRSIGSEPDVTVDDASLVASSAFILAAWLLRRHKATWVA